MALLRTNLEKGAEFAPQLFNDGIGPLIDVGRVADIFMSQNMVQHATSSVLDSLEDYKSEQGHLQTRLLEMNLIQAPQVARNEIFTHYDRPKISDVCERADLFQRTLEHYENINDIEGAVVHTNGLQPDVSHNFFVDLAPPDLLHVNIRQNVQVVIQIATKNSDIVGPIKVIEVFKSFRSFEDLYCYIGSIVNLCEDPEVHFKYIQPATRTGQIREAERICHESNLYNPEKVKTNFLSSLFAIASTSSTALFSTCTRMT